MNSKAEEQLVRYGVMIKKGKDEKAKAKLL